MSVQTAIANLCRRRFAVLRATVKQSSDSFFVCVLADWQAAKITVAKRENASLSGVLVVNGTPAETQIKLKRNSRITLADKSHNWLGTETHQSQVLLTD